MKFKSSIAKRNLLIAILFVLISTLNVYAAPSITATSGSFTHGQTVIVNGTGFGTKSPVSPAVVDFLTAYSGYTNGQIVPTGGCDQEANQTPCLGTNPVGWVSGNGWKVGYKTTNPRGKWTAAYSNSWSGSPVNGAALGGIPITGGTSSKVVYLSWHMYNGSNPSPNGDTSNKFLRLDSQGNYGPGLLELVLESSHCVLYPYGGSNTDLWDGWTGTWPAWNRMEVSMSNPTGNTLNFSWWTNNVLQGNHTNSFSLLPYIITNLGADAANAPMGTVDWNSIYADNTLARVEVCNANTKSGSNHCEIQIPKTQWVDGTLQITVNQGSFADSSTAYLYVIDASGNVSTTNSVSTITFGSSSGGSSDTSPPVISTPLPSGTLAYGTTSTTMNVVTNEAATCKYGTSNVAYASLPNTFNTTGGISHSQTLTSLTNGGSYTYYVRCIDGSGNADTTSTAVTFNVSNTAPPSDNTPPNNVSITAPASGATVTGNTTVTAAASDNVAVTKVEFYIDSTSSSAVATATTSPYTFTWNTNTVADGSHTLYAKAYDAANNFTVSTGISVTVSNIVSAGTNTVTFGNTTDSNYPNTLEDSFLDISTTLFSSSTLLSSYTWPANKPANAILMKWNLSALPANAQIQSATLQLYMNYMEYGGGDSLYTIPAHKLINKSPLIAKATGYSYDGTNSWDPNSIPYNSVPMAQSDIDPAVDTQQINTAYGYKSWNVTSIVKDWVTTPAKNFGLLLNGSIANSADSNRGFASSRASDPAQRPKLVVTYTVGPIPVKNLKATVISSN